MRGESPIANIFLMLDRLSRSAPLFAVITFSSSSSVVLVMHLTSLAGRHPFQGSPTHPGENRMSTVHLIGEFRGSSGFSKTRKTIEER